jgi:hypothetical protein
MAVKFPAANAAFTSGAASVAGLATSRSIQAL